MCGLESTGDSFQDDGGMLASRGFVVPSAIIAALPVVGLQPPDFRNEAVDSRRRRSTIPGRSFST
jgi:hypothetical protein